MKNISFLAVISFVFFSGCEKTDINCRSNPSLDTISSRDFHMGFSTWAFGPDESDRIETYRFISQHADIYSEQVDNKIPWKALINNTDLPAGFIAEMDYRLNKKISGHKLLLSVSLLNTDRSDLLPDMDGSVPEYVSMNDPAIENAYFKHLEYLITRFNPDYLVFAMEVNELKMKSEEKWQQYKLLASAIRARLKTVYPELKVSESVTLHNFYNPEVDDPAGYIQELTDYFNGDNDFAAISYYPFFKGQHSGPEFQQAFDFLHEHISKPIAFAETAHLAETRELESYDLVIESDGCEQKEYLETLLLNANQNDYEFIIWWTFHDFDELWETFPDEYRDLGKLWRDTGILDENGKERPAYEVWELVFKK
jgi:hypothetical protein